MRILLLSFILISLLFSADKNLLNKQEYKTALSYFQKKDYKKSYELFNNLFQENLSNILVNYYLGRSAYEIGLFQEALSAYERILIYEEKNSRVRIELAQTYKMMKLYTHAIKEFKVVLEDKTIPKKVEQKVRQSISFLEAKLNKHLFRTSILSGLIFDSNIDSSPEAGTFNVYSPVLNSTIPLTNNGDKDESIIYQLATNLNYKYKSSDTVFYEFSATPFLLDYEKDKNKNIQGLSLSLSPNYLKKDKKYSLAFLYDYVRKDDKTYQNNYYLNPSYSKVLDKNSLIKLGLKLGRIDYFSELKDADVLRVDGTYSYNTKNLGLFSFALEFGKEFEKYDSRTDVALDYNSFNFINNYALTSNNLLQTKLSYKKTKYEDEDINFLNRREDEKYDVSIALQNSLSKNLNFVFSTSYSEQKSNQASFEYDKYSLKSTLIYSF